MSHQRHIARVITVPPLGTGFIGSGHLATQVVSPGDFALNDPFIMLADDHLDIGDRPVGGPHPHAGFETVTLILDGAIFDRDEGGTLNAGEVQWMTAGSGEYRHWQTALHGVRYLRQLRASFSCPRRLRVKRLLPRVRERAFQQPARRHQSTHDG